MLQKSSILFTKPLWNRLNLALSRASLMPSGCSRLLRFILPIAGINAPLLLLIAALIVDDEDVFAVALLLPSKHCANNGRATPVYPDVVLMLSAACLF